MCKGPAVDLCWNLLIGWFGFEITKLEITPLGSFSAASACLVVPNIMYPFDAFQEGNWDFEIICKSDTTIKGIKCMIVSALAFDM